MLTRHERQELLNLLHKIDSAITNDELDEASADLHMWLVHGDGSPCGGGCDSIPDPERVRFYQECEPANG